MERHTDPPIAVVLQPGHELGLAVSRYLAHRGARLVAIDSDLAHGQAFCRRLSSAGALASFRILPTGQGAAAAALRSDLELVYGRVDWLISFYAGPMCTPGWRQSALASRVIEKQVASRLELLRTLAPLLEAAAAGTMVHVCLGVAPGVQTEVAAAWERLLADRWRAAGIVTRTLAAAAMPEPIGTDGSTANHGDLKRLIAALGWESR